MAKGRQRYNNRNNSRGARRENEKGQYNKSNPKDKECNPDSMDQVRSNNIEWWNKSPIYPDANRIPINVIPGYCYANSDILPKPGFNDAYGLGVDMGWGEAVPGIMTIDYVPFTGPCYTWNDPINKSWMSIFSAYAAKTSGTFQIQQADLAMVGEAANNIIVNIFELKRLLGVSNLYSNVNQYLPNALITALGFAPASVLGEQDAIRRELNYLISAFNSLNLPGYTDMHLRRAQLAHNIYADEDNIKAQLFAFRSRGFYLYVDTKDSISDAEHLMWQNYGSMTNRRPQDLLAIIQTQINALRNSASFGLISAAVLRAFGDRQLLRIELEPVDSITVPVYDRNMNWQISNADIMTNLDFTSLHLTCDIVGNALQCMPKAKASATPNDAALLFIEHKWLNSYDGNMDQEFMMEATRFKISSTSFNDPEFDPTQFGAEIDICGTEILVGLQIWNNEQASQAADPVISSTSERGTMLVYQGDYTHSIAVLAENITKFRNHPLTSIMVIEPASKTYQIRSIGDLYSYTRIEQSALRGLHTAALQSIYTLNPAIEVGNKV